MALKYNNRIKETTTTTGTGTISLAGALTGFRNFVSGVGDGNTCYYCINDSTDWEVGLGTVTDSSPDTLSRDTVLDSSNAGSLVSFASGTKVVFCTYPASVTAGIKLLSDGHPLLFGGSSSGQSKIEVGSTGTATLTLGSASAAAPTITTTNHATKGVLSIGSIFGFDEANTRFGIGLTNPTYTLELSGSSASVVSLKSSATTNNHLYINNQTASTGNHIINSWKLNRTGGTSTEAFFIDVSLGSIDTSNYQSFVVLGSAVNGALYNNLYFTGNNVSTGNNVNLSLSNGISLTTDRLVIDDGSTNVGIAIVSRGTDTDPYIKFELVADTPTFIIGVDDSDGDKFKISTTALGTNDRLVIDSTGKVGIGLASPDSNLDVLTQIEVSGSSSGASTWAVGSTGTSTLTLGSVTGAAPAISTTSHTTKGSLDICGTLTVNEANKNLTIVGGGSGAKLQTFASSANAATIQFYSTASKLLFNLINNGSYGSSILDLYNNAETGTHGINFRLSADTALPSYTLNSFSLGTSSTSNGTSVFVVGSGSAPSTNVTDAWQVYSADIAAGNAAPHFRTENGTVIKLYQTGTYSVTNLTTDRTYNANSTTVDELADVLGTLIADLRLLGLVA